MTDLLCPEVGIGLRRETVGRLKMPPFERSYDIIRQYVRNHKGEPFNPIEYPWCESICDVWDDRNVTELVFQFAARTGKTQLALSLMVASLSRDPTTFMYGNANEDPRERHCSREMVQDVRKVPPDSPLGSW